MEDSKLVVAEKYKSESWKFRTIKTVVQETQIDNYSIEKISTTGIFSMKTPIEEMKPVVLVKDEFEYRKKLQ